MPYAFWVIVSNTLNAKDILKIFIRTTDISK
jgi:hypothetical protein